MAYQAAKGRLSCCNVPCFARRKATYCKTPELKLKIKRRVYEILHSPFY